MAIPNNFSSFISFLNTPRKIQDYILHKLKYNDGDTYQSFAGIMQSKTADCFEATVPFAYLLLTVHGYNPSIVFMQAEHDFDHTLTVYQVDNKWGSIAYSREEELGGKPAIYPTLRDLIWSYYDDYLSWFPEYKGEHTLRGFSDPIDLISRFGSHWFFLPGENALMDLYDHIADDVYCTSLSDGSRYPYPIEPDPRKVLLHSNPHDEAVTKRETAKHS